MTFPIKKRINTELFIDVTKGLYIHNVDKETDQENIPIRINWSKKITDLLEEGKIETAVKVNAGMKTRQPVWNDLPLQGRKDKVKANCLKKLWAKIVKNIVVWKNRVFECILWWYNHEKIKVNILYGHS